MASRIWTPADLGLAAVSMTAQALTSGTVIGDLTEFDEYLLLIYLNAGGVFPTAMTVRFIPQFTDAAAADGPTIYAGSYGQNPYSAFRNPVGWRFGKAGATMGDYGANAAIAVDRAPNPWPIPRGKFAVDVSTVGAGAATCALRLYGWKADR